MKACALPVEIVIEWGGLWQDSNIDLSSPGVGGDKPGNDSLVTVSEDRLDAYSVGPSYVGVVHDVDSAAL